MYTSKKKKKRYTILQQVESAEFNNTSDVPLVLQSIKKTYEITEIVQ